MRIRLFLFVILASLTALVSCSQTTGLVRDSCSVASDICEYVNFFCDSTALYRMSDASNWSELDSLVSELKASQEKGK